MATNSALAKSVLKEIQNNLLALSFRKKGGGGFYRELQKDTRGYVGLNLATHLPNNRIGISPIVGGVLFADRGPDAEALYNLSLSKRRHSHNSGRLSDTRETIPTVGF